MSYVAWFAELSRDDVSQAGGKGANLGEMTKLGMRVPPGFAISVDGYRRFMELTGLKDRITAYFASLGLELRHSVAKQIEASRATQQMIRETPVPPAIADEITANYRTLCERCGCQDLAVAVRSSGAVPNDITRGRSSAARFAAVSTSRSAGASSTAGPGRPEAAAVKAMST